ncbi:MAG: hypothetical protein ACYDAC_10345 [Candidatus Dormibacteria bacterium]
MWWSPLQRRRPTRRPDGGCTHVELDEDTSRSAGWHAPPPSPEVDGGLRAAALLAAHVHAEGPPITGALNAASVLHHLTVAGGPQRFQAWLLQGLYHLLAAAEAAAAGRGDIVVDAHRGRARGVLRLAATSPEVAVRRRADLALRRLAVEAGSEEACAARSPRLGGGRADPIMAPL